MAHQMAPFPGLLLLLASRNSVVYRCLDFYLHSGFVGWLVGVVTGQLADTPTRGLDN